MKPVRAVADHDAGASSPTRSCGAGPPRLRDRLQASPDHERLVLDARPPRRRADRRPSSAITAGGVVGPDGVERRPTRSSTAPASAATTSSRRWRSAGRGGNELNEVWRDAPSAYLGMACQRLPQHVRPLRAEHQPRRGLGDLHARVPVQLRRSTRSGGSRGAAALASTSGPRRRRSGRRRSTAAAPTRSGSTAAAATGTSTSAGATPTTGPAPGSSTGGAPGGSTRPTTSSSPSPPRREPRRAPRAS